MIRLDNRIDRVRWHAPSGSARRERMEQFAADVELLPRTLPPDALLFVRRLSATWRHDEGRSERARAVQVEVARAATRAMRPWMSEVAWDADVVLFESTAQWLACVAVVLASGQRPWWLAWTAGSVASVASTWCEHLSAVPTAVRLLVETRRLAVLPTTLDSAAVHSLTQALVEHWSLPELALVLRAARVRIASDNGSQPAWVASPVPGLEVVAAPSLQLFVAIAHTLAVAPSMVRAPSFARAVGEWSQPSTVPAEISHRREPRVDAASAVGPAASDIQVPDHSPRRVSTQGTPTGAASDASSVPMPTAVAANAPAPQGETVAVASSHVRGEAIPPVELPPMARRSTSSFSAIAAVPAVDPTSSRADDLLPAAFLPPAKTRLGGVFYLLNVLVALDVFGDFTQPLHRGPGPSIWDVVAGMAWRLLRLPRHWLGRPPLRAVASARAALARDPVWRLLAEFAGHEGLPREPRAAPDWIMPPAVTELLGRERWHAPERWLAMLAVATRRRLAGFVPDVPAAWLVEAAEVRRTAARLDIDFGLAAHPVALRIAGLDRDPGWIGHAGYDVRFHYRS